MMAAGGKLSASISLLRFVTMATAAIPDIRALILRDRQRSKWVGRIMWFGVWASVYGLGVVGGAYLLAGMASAVFYGCVATYLAAFAAVFIIGQLQHKTYMREMERMHADHNRALAARIDEMQIAAASFERNWGVPLQ